MGMPSKKEIRAYWAKKLVELGKFDSITEFMEDDYCFACGSVVSDHESTERSHILARWKDGSDNVSNIHMLCQNCHKDSEHLSGDKYWQWFTKRTMFDKMISYAMSHGFSLSSLFNKPQD